MIDKNNIENENENIKNKQDKAKNEDDEIRIDGDKECPQFNKLLHLYLYIIELKDSFKMSLFFKNKFNIFNLEILELCNHCSIKI